MTFDTCSERNICLIVIPQSIYYNTEPSVHHKKLGQCQSRWRDIVHSQTWVFLNNFLFQSQFLFNTRINGQDIKPFMKLETKLFDVCKNLNNLFFFFCEARSARSTQYKKCSCHIFYTSDYRHHLYLYKKNIVIKN